MAEEKTTIPTGYKGATFDLQKILDKFGITGTGLAEMMGVSQPSVAIWMKRGTVSLSTAFRIATVLKCDIRELFLGYKGDDSTEPQEEGSFAALENDGNNVKVISCPYCYKRFALYD